MLIEVDQTVPPYNSYAAERTRGLYNVDTDDGRRFVLKAELPIEKEWSIGVVVGPSGSGKSSILRQLRNTGWTEWVGGDAVWPADQPIIEALGKDDYAKATAALAAVGLGSVPSWLRPRSVLSMGEGFRADLAALLLATTKTPATVVVDEFTSVLDRQVAQVGAGAFAKAWRRKGEKRRVILFSCHYDILEWIQPDWWLDTKDGLDEFEADRGVVQAREGTFPAAADQPGYPGDRVATLEC